MRVKSDNVNDSKPVSLNRQVAHWNDYMSRKNFAMPDSTDLGFAWPRDFQYEVWNTTQGFVARFTNPRCAAMTALYLMGECPVNQVIEYWVQGPYQIKWASIRDLMKLKERRHGNAD